MLENCNFFPPDYLNYVNSKQVTVKILYGTMVPVGISQNDFIYKYFLTKMKTIIMCFQLSTFNINVKDIKSMDKLILRNIVGHYQGG